MTRIQTDPTDVTTVKAKAAPLGVQLWPTVSPEYAPNFTLDTVTRQIGSNGREYVTWQYQNGNTRVFLADEDVRSADREQRSVSYIVEVNEGLVEASQMGCDWWYARRPAFVASGKLHDVKPACLIAGVIALGPYDQDDAQFMAGHMVEAGGLPKNAVRVKSQRG